MTRDPQRQRNMSKQEARKISLDHWILHFFAQGICWLLRGSEEQYLVEIEKTRHWGKTLGKVPEMWSGWVSESHCEGLSSSHYRSQCAFNIQIKWFQLPCCALIGTLKIPNMFRCGQGVCPPKLGELTSLLHCRMLQADSQCHCWSPEAVLSYHFTPSWTPPPFSCLKYHRHKPAVGSSFRIGQEEMGVVKKWINTMHSAWRLNIS